MNHITENIEMKECVKCNECLPLTAEFFCSSPNIVGNKFRKMCKSCDRLRAKAHYEKNREKRLLTMKAYSEKYDSLNPNKPSTEYRRDYYLKNREHILANKKEYRQNNKEKIYALKQKRRDRSKKLEINLSSKDWAQIKLSFNNECAYCGKEKKLSREHFVPLTKGGEYTRNNIIPACLSCNSSKSDKNFFDWYTTYKYYSKSRERKILNHLNYQNNTQQLALL